MPLARKYAGPYEYFSHKVRIGKPDECWEWKGGCGSKGYGIWQYSFNEYPRVGNAHKRSYILFKEHPKDKLVLHKCGNRKCCNPDHLYAGTYKNNVEDAVEHGTAYIPYPGKGESNVRSKLKEEQVREIKQMLAEGMTHKQIASIYGVTRPAITSIARDKTWGWLQ